MKIDIEQARHMARLARLELTSEELGRFREQLDSILQYMDKLRELDTTGVKPTSHVIPMATVVRADVTLVPLERESSLANAPEEKEGCFKVPRIVG
ncbi:MAG: Asp-tRNA(Asn)/Glu-tRNA(Gln) amidotransferase subunit GatC [Thermodesulfobacteriota bacterium]